MAATPYNLVILAADTLRPDHLSCYGYARQTSPAIDRLAAEGARFADYQAAHIPTHPAFTTLFTGVDPLYHGILAHSGRRQLRPAVPMLAERLHAAGYVTAAIDNMLAMAAGPSWFARGFDYYRAYRYRPGSGEAARLTDWALEFLGLLRAEAAPFALFVHYFDPHTPYAPPSAFRRRFYQGDERDPAATSLAAAVGPDDPLTRLLLGDMAGAGVTDLAYVLAQYDAEIAFLDEQVGRLLAALDEPALRERTLVAFLSDHGEAFGELGLWFDHHTLADAVTRCALILRLPALIPAGLVVEGLASSMDVAPTLLEAAGLPPVEPAALAGRSLWPLLRGEGPARAEAPLGEASRQVSRGVVTPDWRLIEPVTATADGVALPDFRGRPRDPAPLLFARSSGREERCDAAAHPEVAADLRARIRRRLAAAEPFSGVADPFLHTTPSLPYEVLLAKLGQRGA